MSTAIHPNVKLISICGVDGTGKTTLVQKLKSQGEVTLRAPQVHESGSFQVSKASEALERLSQWADQKGDLVTKACALFLAMSLQPRAEAELKESSQPSRIFRERDPILDLVVYSPLYLKILQPTHRFVPALGVDEPLIQACFDSQASLFPGLKLEELPTGLIQFFSQPLTSWIPKLIQVWGVQPPQQVVLLKGSADLLKTRMELKAKSQAKEFHEQLPLLLMLQAGFEEAGKKLSQLYGFKFQTLDLTDTGTPDDVLQRLSNAID